MNEKEAYKVLSAASGIEVGDTVKVLRVAKCNEMGWKNSWIPYMEGQIGKTMVVRNKDVGFGYHCNDSYDYPFFVLEIVKKHKEKVLEVTVSDLEKKYGCKVKVVK